MPSEQPTKAQAAAPESHPCPDCGQPTGSLKKYGFLKSWWVFLALVFFRREDHVACPSCMRKYLLRRSLLIVPVNVGLSIVWLMAVKAAITPLNIVLANIWTEFVFLPYLVVLTVATTRKGHSKSSFAPRPQAIEAPVATAQPKTSWASALLFWLVLLACVFGFVYWLTTLK